VVVEDGTGLTAANSYVSLSDCNTYHSDRGNTSWTGEDADKEAALIRSTQYLDHHYRSQFIGYRYSEEQALEWPRYDAEDDNGYYVDMEIPHELKHAICELALRALIGELLEDQDRGGAVRRVRIAEIETEYSESAPAGTVYRFVDEILGRLLSSGSGSGVRVRRV
jgi:hypothetical protein